MQPHSIDHVVLQEPMFVPRAGSVAEDDGWVIVAVHNAASLKSEVAILDAQR
jgi:carotenoid cleavage dioxygenase-like enzyme